MRIALASPAVASSIDEALEKVRTLIAAAAAQGARIVCFPEAYVPGLRGQDFEVPPFDAADQERAVRAACEWARTCGVATILGLELVTPEGRQVAACVIDPSGYVLGYQTKNQLDPTEDPHYVPGTGRRVFQVDDLRFGVTICHEGWRYPETVRWAAVRGAKVVFHPQHTGSNTSGVVPKQWGAADSPYYEKAMMMRSIENGIYFASVNYALRYPESATSVIDPSGRCQAYLPYGQEGVLVQEIDPALATGTLAMRFAPERYAEQSTSPVFVAKRRFDPSAGERWTHYIAWSGLSQLREVVSLDDMLCPTVPETLTAGDWEHNVHADYQVLYFRSLEYLQTRVAGETGLNILAVVRNPSRGDVESVKLPGFSFAGFDLLDVCGDVSALTNCGGFDEVFGKAELSDLGLLLDLDRAYEVQRALRTAYPHESHARCHVWGVWRLSATTSA